ncbi:molecular chaperone [Vibrio vulnificus]|nr:molecular chaperone [Vibrio vulnificus]
MKRICLLTILLFFFHRQTLAFELFPMVQFLDDAGKGTTVFFKITNTSLAPLPVELIPIKREVSLNNNETLSETDELMVFPPQVLIEPGKSQSIKVQYIGEPKQSAASYRLIASQLPLKNEASSDSIQMLFRIGALIFVSPQDARADYSSHLTQGENDTVQLTIRNDGTSVLELTKLSHEVSWHNQKKIWSWVELEPLLPMQYLVPNQSVVVNVQSLLVK